MKDIVRWRRELHQIPELGLKEYKTAQYLRNELTLMGYHYEEILDTGTLVYIDHHQKETLAFRSDIDALPIKEKNDIDFKSTHDGCMHACGHDGHMSALLGLAKELRTVEDAPYNYLLIFQPAEEAPGAAKDIVESGIFDKYHVKTIFGMHLMPFLEEGKVGCKSGPLMAQCGEFDVLIKGKGAHAGLPHQGIDSILIASEAILSYQTIISRRVSPFEQAIINVGTIKGGDACNAVADSVTLRGTMRCYNEDVFNDMVMWMNKIHQGLEENYNCEIEFSCPPMYPPLINDEDAYQRFKSLVNKDYYQELKEPLMLSEDFAFYGKAVPSLFFFLGIRTDSFTSGLHTDTFNFNEDVLEKGIETYMTIAKYY